MPPLPTGTPPLLGGTTWWCNQEACPPDLCVNSKFTTQFCCSQNQGKQSCLCFADLNATHQAAWVWTQQGHHCALVPLNFTFVCSHQLLCAFSDGSVARHGGRRGRSVGCECCVPLLLPLEELVDNKQDPVAAQGTPNRWAMSQTGGRSEQQLQARGLLDSWWYESTGVTCKQTGNERTTAKASTRQKLVGLRGTSWAPHTPARPASQSATARLPRLYQRRCQSCARLRLPSCSQQAQRGSAPEHQPNKVRHDGVCACLHAATGQKAMHHPLRLRENSQHQAGAWGHAACNA